MVFEDHLEAEEELNSLIKEYKASDITLFKDFAEYLNKYKNEIINSFAVYEVIRRTADEQEAYYARLSNGPMEGFWGIIKRERYYGKRFTDKGSLVNMIKEYIEYYNNRRLQRNLGIITPIEKYEMYLAA